MVNINIKKKQDIENGWSFLVEVEEDGGALEYLVSLDKEYWGKLTGGKIKPNELIHRSFEFLLEREPKESILKEFNLELINKYFPEYESEILLNFKI